jgi:hypothetical protein
MSYICPNNERWPDDIIGCGRVVDREPDDEGIVDCPHCGIWFTPDEEEEVNACPASRQRASRR